MSVEIADGFGGDRVVIERCPDIGTAGARLSALVAEFPQAYIDVTMHPSRRPVRRDPEKAS